MINKNSEFLIDKLLNFLNDINADLLGNLNGNLIFKIKNLENKIIDNGEISLVIKEKKLKIINSFFKIKKVGIIKSELGFYEEEGDKIFISKNVFEISDKKEFAKKFHLRTKKIKEIKKIFFNLEKNIDTGEFFISNVHLNKINQKKLIDEVYHIKNNQALKSLIRKFLY